MYGAVIDTNVVVSAMISPEASPPAEIIDRWRAGAFTWVTSAFLIDELSQALTYPKVVRLLKWDADRRETFLRAMRMIATVVEPQQVLQVSRDPDDSRVLEAAIAGHAGYVVTGDNDLLELGAYEGIQVVTPAAFVALLAR